MASHAPLQIDSPYLRSLLAGGIAGTTVDMSLYPIDTLKTRLQSARGFHASGGFRGIYKGVGSAFVGSAPGAALFFVAYEAVKTRLEAAQGDGGTWAEPRSTEESLGMVESRTGLDARGVSGPLAHMLAASVGELAACAVRVPTEVVKQRAQAAQHRSSWAALRAIVRLRVGDGIGGGSGGGGAGGGGILGGVAGCRRVWRELFRGWGITVAREVPFTMVQFPLWEALKARAAARRRKRRRLMGGDGIGNGDGPGRAMVVSGAESALYGSVAGAVAAAVTTPLDVLKTRVMLARERVSAGSVFMQILRESGPGAFLAGIGPRVVWISAGGAVFLGSYQWASNALGGKV